MKEVELSKTFPQVVDSSIIYLDQNIAEIRRVLSSSHCDLSVTIGNELARTDNSKVNEVHFNMGRRVCNLIRKRYSPSANSNAEADLYTFRKLKELGFPTYNTFRINLRNTYEVFVSCLSKSLEGGQILCVSPINQSCDRMYLSQNRIQEISNKEVFFEKYRVFVEKLEEHNITIDIDSLFFTYNTSNKELDFLVGDLGSVAFQAFNEKRSPLFDYRGLQELFLSFVSPDLTQECQELYEPLKI